MRAEHYSDARGSTGRSLRRLAGLTMGGVTTILLLAGLPLGAFRLPVFDVTIAALYLARRMGLVRTALCTVGLCILAVSLMPPICSGGRYKSYVAAIKSDLKNVASQQEIFYADHNVYTSNLEDMGFVQSDGVTVVLFSSRSGWTAWATHAALGSSEGCAVYFGDELTPALAEVEPSVPGEIVCTL